jgi:caffeoyl-CoA O-methyltransferase
MKAVLFTIISFVLGAAGFAVWPDDRKVSDVPTLDAGLKKFMDSRRGTWRDLNVPEVDGKALYDIVIQHGYKNALEIGTSTGYSGLWISWALSKTGGKLITIDIDPDRHKEAVANFREAGLAKYVDARLGDAHELVPALAGPFDFVFCDADKEWYSNYLKAVLSKITAGGCFAAHNVSDFSSMGGRGGFRRGFGSGPTGDFLEYAKSLSTFDTKVLSIPGSSGLSVSYKKQ